MLHRPSLIAAEGSSLHRDLARDILTHLQARGARNGEILSRLALAQALGVSRTPVSGALALLEQLGAVETRGRAVHLLDPAFDPARLGPPADSLGEEVARLIVAMARDRRAGTLPDEASERFLRGHYSVPRIVMDHALRQLGDIGAVARNRGHGWRFSSGYASAEDREAAYRFRLMIEPQGLLEPAFTLPPGWIARMREQHQAFLGREWAAHDPIAFFETNAAFHLGLAESSGNRFLIQAMEQQNRLRRFSNYGWQRGMDRVRVSASEHIAVLDALEAGLPEEAAKRLRQHLSGTLALPWPRPA